VDNKTESIAWSAEMLALAARFGNAPAVNDGNASISYVELARRAHDGHQPGSRRVSSA